MASITTGFPPQADGWGRPPTGQPRELNLRVPAEISLARRTHLSLDKDCPDARSIQPPNNGKVIAIAQVDGLHHRNQHLAD